MHAVKQCSDLKSYFSQQNVLKLSSWKLYLKTAEQHYSPWQQTIGGLPLICSGLPQNEHPGCTLAPEVGYGKFCFALILFIWIGSYILQVPLTSAFNEVMQGKVEDCQVSDKYFSGWDGGASNLAFHLVGFPKPAAFRKGSRHWELESKDSPVDC